MPKYKVLNIGELAYLSITKMKSYANDCKKAREHVFKKIYFSLQCCNLQYDLYSYRYIIVPLYYVEWKFFAIFI
ncbi:hypothetical protein KP07_04365 [Candidatus Liberibacter solanacearum]|nr:hypothetical protein KP07_04365 [Candidatus Liberibacter solanacearum]